MSNSNYPAGVTDAHPHFNPQEIEMEVSCNADTAPVVPSHLVKTKLTEIEDLVKLAEKGRVGALQALMILIGETRSAVEDIEDVADFECPFNSSLMLDVSEEAAWTCEVCGQDRTTDTVPEERDPDEGWDDRNGW